MAEEDRPWAEAVEEDEGGRHKDGTLGYELFSVRGAGWRLLTQAPKLFLLAH